MFYAITFKKKKRGYFDISIKSHKPVVLGLCFHTLHTNFTLFLNMFWLGIGLVLQSINLLAKYTQVNNYSCIANKGKKKKIIYIKTLGPFK